MGGVLEGKLVFLPKTSQQSEAVFAPAFDRLVMRTALSGMLDGRSTEAVETGLDRVYSGQIERYPFTVGDLEGHIERNRQGYIHIYVR